MMAENFTRKRVGSLTLGEKLQKIRSDHRISLGEVSRATKIQVKYLEALESGAYDKLPPDVYVRGFLRGYASFLGVPEDAILKLYDRERSIQKNLGKVEPSRFQPRVPVSFSVMFSAKALITAFAILFSGIFFIYLYLELRSFVSEPRLVILSPADQETIDGSEVAVKGETDPRATVAINGEGVTVDENGNFEERVALSPGVNTFEVSSTNRFGKQRVRSFSVRTEEDPTLPEATLPTMITPVLNAVSISVRVAETVAISVKADGALVWSGEVAPTEEKMFEASESVVISAEKGNAVMVRFRNGQEEALSESDKSAEASYGKNGRF